LEPIVSDATVTKIVPNNAFGTVQQKKNPPGEANRGSEGAGKRVIRMSISYQPQMTVSIVSTVSPSFPSAVLRLRTRRRGAYATDLLTMLSVRPAPR
jgi:hypothetical protein